MLYLTLSLSVSLEMNLMGKRDILESLRTEVLFMFILSELEDIQQVLFVTGYGSWNFHVSE